MTRHSQYARRESMHLDGKALPFALPIERTLLCVLAAHQWPDYWWIFGGVIGVSWMLWLGEQIYGMPVDIFEHYRAMPKDAGLGEPLQ